MRPVNYDLVGTAPVAGRSAFWTLANTREDATSIRFPLGSTFLYLDPHRTSPNVQLGIETEDGAIHYVSPGDVVALPRGTTRARVWNPLRGLVPGVKLTGLVGFLGLLAGHAGDLDAVQACQADRVGAPVYPGSVLWHGSVQTGTVIAVPTMNLVGMRVSAVGMLLADGSPSLPTDFAATIGVALYSGLFGLGQVNDTAPGSALASLPVQGIGELPSSAGQASVLHYQGDLNLAFAGNVTANLNNTARDFEIAVGTLMVALTPSGYAGSGIVANRIMLTVEGR